MKKTILLLSLLISKIFWAQTDTIFKADGEILGVNVIEVAETTVKYSYPGESISNSINKNTISKIHFKSGRIQEFASSTNMVRVKSCLDWDKVQISKIESEVAGLSKIDVIGSKARGMTTLSSLAKLQDRAFNKIKVETAMLGGNVAYIMEQTTETSINGGQYGGSRLPSVTISGLAYTSKKVSPGEIIPGNYNVTSVYVLYANEFEMSHEMARPQTLNITKEEILSTNNFQKLKLNISSVSNVKEYTIIYADESEMVLSGVNISKQGKKTYYNVMLRKKLND